jgi:tetratricopeptide (TPR) repeat protein
VARVGAAFLVYLGLQRLWTWSGLERLYDSLVMGLAAAVFLPTQHFPIVPSLENMSLRNLDFAVVFTLSLFLVSTGIPWKSRLRRFALVLLVLYGLHVLAVILQVKVVAALDLNRQFGLLTLLPWEFTIVDRLKYLLYDFGLQAGPFVVALLSVAWNSGLRLPGRAPSPGRVKRALAIGIVSLIVVGVASLTWSAWRESHPLHVGAHARLGQLYEENGNLAGAEEQYRTAIEGGTGDPLVFYNRAMLALRSGRRREALDALEQGRRATRDPTWSARFEQAIDDLRANVP